MALGIRQFLTYEETVKRDDDAPDSLRFRDLRRTADSRQKYFDALEMLRGHLSRCLGQVATIAGTQNLTSGLIVNYQGGWQLEAYVPPTPSDEP
jgi:hypothetical protein